MERFAGTYETMGISVVVSVQDGSLFAAVPGRGESPLELVAGTKYRAVAMPQITIEFQVDNSGAVSQAAVSYGGMSLTARRRD